MYVTINFTKLGDATALSYGVLSRHQALGNRRLASGFWFLIGGRGV
jgi:hypothetical protein